MDVYWVNFSRQINLISETLKLFNCNLAHTDPLEKEIKELADGLAAIKDEQEYIVIREQRHRDSKYFILGNE